MLTFMGAVSSPGLGFSREQLTRCVGQRAGPCLPARGGRHERTATACERADVLRAARSVRLITNREGRATGQAFVEFPTQAEAAAGLAMDRQMMGSRYVEAPPPRAACLTRPVCTIGGWRARRGAWAGRLAGGGGASTCESRRVSYGGCVLHKPCFCWCLLDEGRTQRVCGKD